MDKNQLDSLIDEKACSKITKHKTKRQGSDLKTWGFLSDTKYLTAASKSFELAVNLTESLRMSISSDESKQLLLSENIDLYQQFIATLYDLGTSLKKPELFSQAFYVSEMSRARSFLDHLQDQIAREQSKLPEKIKQSETLLMQKIGVIEENIFVELKKKKKARSNDKIQEWQQEKRSLQQDYQDLVDNIAKDYPEYAGLRYPKTQTLDTIREQFLKIKDSVLLSYVLGKDASYGWKIGSTDIEMAKLSPAGDYNALVKKYRETLSEPLIRESWDDPDVIVDTTKAHTSTGIQLYRKTLEPLIKEGDDVTALTIIPDGILHYLPFETLVRKFHPITHPEFKNGREYVIHKHAVHYSSSAGVLSVIQKQKELRNQKSLVLNEFIGFGDPEFNPGKLPKVKNICDSGVTKRGIGLKKKAKKTPTCRPVTKRGISLKKKRKKEVVKATAGFTPNPTFQALNFYKLDRLFNTTPELKSISRLFDTSQKIFLRKEALESKAKQNLENYKYIHFATHGILDEITPEYSGVVLNIVRNDKKEDGFLQASEIYDLKLNADLVTLSACETGLGKVIEGEGVVGLTRAFQYAGTSSIVVSLWSVADESTAKLMIYFYNQLKNGVSKDQALRNAKLKLMNVKNHEFVDPFFWGPFVLNGLKS